MKKNIFFAFLTIFFSVGCTGPGLFVSPIINGIIAWKEGEAHKYYGHNTDTILRATKHALTKMNLPISKEETKSSGYYLVAGNNNRFKIKIHKVENEITKLSIRINFMGDKPYAELFYKNVDKEINVIKFDKNGNPVKTKII